MLSRIARVLCILISVHLILPGSACDREAIYQDFPLVQHAAPSYHSKDTKLFKYADSFYESLFIAETQINKIIMSTRSNFC